jgi:glycosyltransferase involved in cell wall biosynthesis
MESAQKLLILCHGFPPYYGGAEHAAFDLAKEAVKAGHRVTVVTSDIGGRLPARETMDGMQIIRVHARKKRWSFHTTLELMDFLRMGMKRMPAIVKDIKPDFIWAHFSVPAGFLARKSFQRFGIPYGVVLHGSDVPGYQPGRFRAIYPALRRVVRPVWKDACAVVAVSDDLRKLAAKTWPSGTIDVIPNGVDTDRFAPSATPTEASTVKLQARVVAQWIERKGIHFLLDAIAALDGPARDTIEWHLYGSGPYEAELHARIATHRLSQHVHMHGLLPRDELADLLCENTDLFVLPSLQEGLPLALLEALSAGTAVIATRVGGIPSALKDGHDAILTDPGDVEQLRDAILRLTQDATFRHTLQSNGRQTALRYSWAASWRQ